MTQSHGASLDRTLFSNPDTSLANPNILSAKLELTFPYLCGHRVAAEFDARVTIGQEDSVLLIGEVELFGYDNDHQVAYETCVDLTLCHLIRNYVENSTTERDRAYEALHQQKASRKIQKENLMLPPRPGRHTNRRTDNAIPLGTSHNQGFGAFVHSFASTYAIDAD